MQTSVKLPEGVSWEKTSDWVRQLPVSGVHLVAAFCLQAEKHCNWVLFYSWCLVRTECFKNKCWYEGWDACNSGNTFGSSKDGITHALNEFLKLKDTSEMQEETRVLLTYGDILEFCGGIVYSPTPLPPADKPEVPPEKEQPVPETPPEKEKENPTNWKGILKIAGPILLAILGAASIFIPVPGWVKILVETILKALGG